MAAKKQASKPAEKPKAEGSVVAGLDKVVRELAEQVEEKVNQVGGDIARGHGLRAVELLTEASEALYQAEKEDK